MKADAVVERIAVEVVLAKPWIRNERERLRSKKREVGWDRFKWGVWGAMRVWVICSSLGEKNAKTKRGG